MENEETGPTGSYIDEDGVSHTLVVGMNDHPSITFGFDTHNFHSPDTKWFLDSLYFDGCRVDGCPMSFYQDIIDFCQHKIKQIPHWEVSEGEATWVE